MKNVIDFMEFARREKCEGFDVYTVDEFKSVMNGAGYDDDEFKVYLSPFVDDFDNCIAGWFITFFHAELNKFCAVVEDDHNGVNDFVLYYKPISKIFDIFNSLLSCPRKITVHHFNECEDTE